MTEESEGTEKTDKSKKSSDALRKAIIGLVGTVLTVCGGTAGALLTAGATIYQIEQERRQVALAAPASAQTLRVDTRQIAIRQAEAERLDPEEWIVVPNLGFALAQPLMGWDPMEEMTYRGLFQEQAALSPMVFFYSLAGLAWDGQPVHRIRYEEPVPIQFQEGSKENGLAVDVEKLRELAGSDTLDHYSQVTILTIEKAASADHTLADIALAWGTPQRGGVNRIVANRGDEYIWMQTSWQLENVRVDGENTRLSVERWALFAEGPHHFYVTEITYVPGMRQPMQVWEDLQTYMDSFRVIQ